jgi:hypothetical protein
MIDYIRVKHAIGKKNNNSKNLLLIIVLINNFNFHKKNPDNYLNLNLNQISFKKLQFLKKKFNFQNLNNTVQTKAYSVRIIK